MQSSVPEASEMWHRDAPDCRRKLAPRKQWLPAGMHSATRFPDMTLVTRAVLSSEQVSTILLSRGSTAQPMIGFVCIGPMVPRPLQPSPVSPHRPSTQQDTQRQHTRRCESRGGQPVGTGRAPCQPVHLVQRKGLRRQRRSRGPSPLRRLQRCRDLQRRRASAKREVLSAE